MEELVEIGVAIIVAALAVGLPALGLRWVLLRFHALSTKVESYEKAAVYMIVGAAIGGGVVAWLL